MTQSDVHVKAEEIHPPLKQAHEMPYAPAIEVVGASQILFRSAATPSPKYHQHPLPRDEHALPDDIEEQTRSATAGSRSVVDPLNTIAVGGVS